MQRGIRPGIGRWPATERTPAGHQVWRLTCCLTPLWLLWTVPIGAAEQPPILVDRIVAVVGESLIFRSDIERAIAFATIRVPDGGSEDERDRRVLEALIDRRLRLDDARRFATEPVDPQAVREQVAALRARLPDAAAFAAQLEATGMDQAALERRIADQLLVLRYIDERLRARVFVSAEEISHYYHQEIEAEATARGASPPPLDEVRDAIRTLLVERGLDQEITRWTMELRKRADVVILLGQETRTLPPLDERQDHPHPP